MNEFDASPIISISILHIGNLAHLHPSQLFGKQPAETQPGATAMELVYSPTKLGSFFRGDTTKCTVIYTSSILSKFYFDTVTNPCLVGLDMGWKNYPVIFREYFRSHETRIPDITNQDSMEKISELLFFSWLDLAPGVRTVPACWHDTSGSMAGWMVPWDYVNQQGLV